MIIVTSGARYIDIDAYACCVAYAELLNVQGTPAQAASTAVWNQSITKSVRALNVPFSIGYAPKPDDRFVVIDLSDPAQFDELVDPDRVVEVIDHHPGFEAYWADKLGKRAQIEFIGAAATLVYERWVAAGAAERMSKESAKLLVSAILDNTLNFGAGVTTDRDRQAYAFLARRAGLNDNWTARYFTECQEAIITDLASALRNDTKFLKFHGLPGQLCLGQLVVWDAKEVIAKEQRTIAKVLGDMSELWLANVVSIAENKSYLLAQDTIVKTWAEALLTVHFSHSLAIADRLWLRKEIMKAGLVSSPH